MTTEEQNRIMREALEKLEAYAVERAMCSVYLDIIAENIRHVLASLE